jgi:hypothetical protein
MRHGRRLAGGIGGMPGGSAQRSCRGVGSAGRRAGLRHRDLAACPRPSLLDRVARPRVRRLHRLEEVQNVLCARGRPQSQEPMVAVRERSPAADGDEAGVAVFGKDHGGTRPVASAQLIVSHSHRGGIGTRVSIRSGCHTMCRGGSIGRQSHV